MTLALAEKARRIKVQRERNPIVVLPPDITGSTSLVLDTTSPFNDLMKPRRYKIYRGGRGGAKSWAFAEALVRKASSSSIRVLCTRETQNSIEDSVHHLLKVTIYRLNLQSWFTITKTSIRSRSGAEFKFRGLRDNNAETIKSFEDADIVWVEEARTVSKTSWKFLTPTVRKAGSEIWISYNPENEDDPVEDLIKALTPEESIVHNVNFDSNPYFTGVLEGERQIDLRKISNATNESERKQAQTDYDHTWLGKYKKINEAVIFSGKWLVQEFPDNLWLQAERLLFGADHGFARDAATLVRSFILDKTLYIEYEAYGVKVELDDLPEMFDKIPEARNWPIKADNSRPETISHLRNKGFAISAADKWAGSVEDGISHMRTFTKIVIHPRCKYTIDEFKQYSYKRDRVTKEVLPVIIDKFNHCIDAIRYSLDKYIQRRGDLGIWERLGSMPK